MSQIRILIVEDELIIAKNTAKKLTALGFDVCKIVSSGQAAIEYTNKEHPDLILMDIAIKGSIDGIDTAAEIKTKHNIPIIFLTAYASEKTLDRAAEIGCYGYLIKPFREKELQATIRMAFAKHKENVVIEQSLRDTVNQYSCQLDSVSINRLTQLPNRLFLRDSFKYLVSTLQHQNASESAESPQIIALYNLSIYRWSKLTSLLESQQQEDLVKQVALRISKYVDSLNPKGVTVHLADDNYVVMLPLAKQIDARSHGQKILELCTDVCHVDSQEIFLNASVGMAFYPNDSKEIEELLLQSQKAVAYIESQGGNRCQAFSFAFDIKNSDRSRKLTIEADLHYALERQELEIYYQPIVNLKDSTVVGAEALLRWNHSTMGRIEPNVFIPIAEESGLIRPIGEWVLLQACKQTKYWHKRGLNWLKININLSGVQFKQSDLFHQITQTLFKSSLDAVDLQLEVTETILIDNIKANIQKLNLLKKLGVEIALDDFGTGYSSLSYLQQFPFDTLKIDACFIRNINSNQTNAVITKSTIQMAHELGLKVVAEGVETEAELNFLLQCGCDRIQGYLVSRPLVAKEFFNLVRNSKVPVQQ